MFMVRNTFVENPAREIECHNGIWCPLGRHDAWGKYAKRAPDMEFAVSRCPEHRTAIQAGGNIGAWPAWLAKRFERVHTFEPETMNFRCLARNMENRTNVFAHNAALSNEPRLAHLSLAKSLGGHHLTPEIGDTLVTTIDVLDCHDADFIMLDIEGWEFEALAGARITIARTHPIIQIEDRGHGIKKGTGKTLEDILALLPGYRPVARVNRDVVLEYRK